MLLIQHSLLAGKSPREYDVSRTKEVKKVVKRNLKKYISKITQEIYKKRKSKTRAYHVCDRARELSQR